MKYYWIGRKDENYEEDDASDLEAISQGFISITQAIKFGTFLGVFTPSVLIYVKKCCVETSYKFSNGAHEEALRKLRHNLG